MRSTESEGQDVEKKEKRYKKEEEINKERGKNEEREESMRWCEEGEGKP